MNRDVHHKIQSFFEQHEAFSFCKETVLIQADEHPSTIFFLHTGVVKQTVITQAGQELCVNLYKPQSFFPLMEIFTEISNRYTFTTMKDCSGWKVPIEAVKDLIQKNLDISLDLNVRLLRGLHGFLIKTERLMEKDAHTLIIQTLLTLSERALIDMPLTHQELADLTGLSRETITRELATLKQSGIVSIQDHIITLHL